jgi:hypothetical protein
LERARYTSSELIEILFNCNEGVGSLSQGGRMNWLLVKMELKYTLNALAIPDGEE